MKTLRRDPGEDLILDSDRHADAVALSCAEAAGEDDLLFRMMFGDRRLKQPKGACRDASGSFDRSQEVSAGCLRDR